MARWDETTTVKFVQYYGEYPCLWKTDDLQYRNKQARDAALGEIVEKMNMAGFGIAEGKVKIKNLRSTYSQELTKIEKSKKSGAGAADAYTPSLKWFYIMQSFMQQVQSKRQTTTNFVSIYLFMITDYSLLQ